MNPAPKSTRCLSPRALAAEVFGNAGLGSAEVAATPPESLFAVEAACVRGAVGARQREFAAGRSAARQAMGWRVAVPMAADRAPVWPVGFAGSISHAGGWALAVAGGAERMIGLDLELDEPLPNEVFDTVLLPDEQAWLNAQPDPARWTRVIFSAKECAYKAQYPRSGQIFGFELFKVVIDPDKGQFVAVFQRDIAPFANGDRLNGRFSRGGGFIVTGIVA